VVERSPSSGVARKKKGIASDRYVVEQRAAHQYYVVDTQSILTLGGPYSDRQKAQNAADALNRSLGW
jgi:hypothetical protein